MTKYWIAFFVPLLGTLLVGFWGCDGLQFQMPTIDVAPASSPAAGPNEEETLEPTEVDDVEPVATYVSQTTTDDAVAEIDTEKPTEVVVLELTVRELKLEMELKETKDQAKRTAIQRDIASVRARRQALYQQEEKGK